MIAPGPTRLLPRNRLIIFDLTRSRVRSAVVGVSGNKNGARGACSDGNRERRIVWIIRGYLPSLNAAGITPSPVLLGSRYRCCSASYPLGLSEAERLLGYHRNHRTTR